MNKKKIICILLCISVILSLCACGKEKPKSTADTIMENVAAAAASKTEPYREVKITLDNLYDYFDYKEYKGAVRSEDGNKINSMTISYGLELKEQYKAANLPDHKDTMEIKFVAEGVVNKGNYEVNYSTLEYTGETESSESNTISETLVFWPKGNRTTVWAYGNYSDTYIIFMRNFKVLSATGSIYIINNPDLVNEMTAENSDEGTAVVETTPEPGQRIDYD